MVFLEAMAVVSPCADDHVMIEMLRELEMDMWEKIALCFQHRLLNHWTEDSDEIWKTQVVTMVKKKNGKLTMRGFRPLFTATSPDSTIPATSSSFPAVPASSGPIFGVFADSAKMGDVSMDFEISKSAEVPGQVEFRESPPVSIHAEASSNGLSESRRQSQSELRPHQISYPGSLRTRGFQVQMGTIG